MIERDGHPNKPQIHAVPSALPVASRRPSGLKATAATAAWCSIRARSWPEVVSQIRAVRSSPAVASRRPWGTEGHRPDRGVVAHPQLLLAGGGVPDPRRPVLAGGGQQATVGAQGDARDHPVMGDAGRHLA